MNRRFFFGRLLGTAVVTTAVTVKPDDPERPLVGIAPFCPRCGSAAMFVRMPELEAHGIDPYNTRSPHRVECHCGWTGQSPVAVKL